jgi:hypothetical protein
MRKNYGMSMLFAAVALCVVPVVAHATPIFSENFNGLPTNLTVTDVGQFQTINGTNVDVVGTTDSWGYLCAAPESVNCVDLGGSGGDPYGQLQTKSAISLAPGNYQLSFDLDGNQRGITATTNIDLGPTLNGNGNVIGSLVSGSITLGSSDGSQLTGSPYVYLFTVTSPANAYLEFDYLNTPGSNGNIGSLLDNVQIIATPEPATLTLFGSGLLGLAAAVRRRMRATRAS